MLQFADLRKFSFPHWQARRTALVELERRLNARTGLLPFTQLFHSSYVPGWVHREVADILDAFMESVERKLSPRLMIFLPPRTGKSELVSTKLPPFLLGHHPDWEVVCATYGQDLANIFGRRVRNLINDPLFLDLFPACKISPDSNAVDLLTTTTGGSYTAVGIGGALAGKGAHALIIDDPVKGREEADSETVRESARDWYSSVARTRLHPGGGVILLMTRYHMDDLAGSLLEHAKNNPDSDQWMVYEYPAIATQDEKHRKAGEVICPERYSLQEVLKTKASLLPRDWSALYQQSPAPPDGLYFKAEWLKLYTHAAAS